MRHTLICTVGTSLFLPNLKTLPAPDDYDEWLQKQPAPDRPYLTADTITALKTAFEQSDWVTLALHLSQLPPTLRLCGAEINSIGDLLQRGYVTPNATLLFCHSDTDDGTAIATLLVHYYQALGHTATPYRVEGLQDTNPKAFRTDGLRNLVKQMSYGLRLHGADYCAINATGGYKAQIAIAVLLGQALKVPVYYKHERFSEIIAFPPMPISLDFDLWIRHNGWLTALGRNAHDQTPWETVQDDWSEALEPLVERVDIDGEVYITLSPTGQVFYEAFRERHLPETALHLPVPVPPQQKRKPQMSSHNWGNARDAIIRYMQQITDVCPYVIGCRTFQWNPALPTINAFRLKGDALEGTLSNGTWTVWFAIDTSSQTPGEQQACLLDLNQRIGKDFG
ncbi:MAG: hypothetical protein OHK0037_06830 [Elainellaceae cyanobacterium]